MTKDFDRGFRLGPWLVLPRRGMIEQAKSARAKINIEPKPMAVLVELARAEGAFVSRDVLREKIWQREHVSDEVISVAVGQLRKALGDDARNPQFIQTMAGRGYRLVADIHPLGSADDNASGSRLAKVGALAVLVAMVLYLGIWRDQEGAPQAELLSLAEVIPDETDRENFLKARFVIHHGDVRNIPEAQETLMALAERYSDAATVHAELAESYIRRFSTGGRAPVTLEKAEAAANQALGLDEANPVALGALGIVHYYRDWNLDAAEDDYRRGLAVDPTNSNLRRRLSSLLGAEGRFDEAWEVLKPLKEADPAAYGTTDTAYLLYLEGRHEEALVLLNELLRIRWNPGDVYRIMAMCFEAQGKFEKAYDATIKHYEFRAYDKSIVGKMQNAYRNGGYQGLSQYFADFAIDLEAQGRQQSPVQIARYLVLAGDDNLALQYLARALDERDPALLTVKVSPEFTALASTARFAEIVYALAVETRS